MARPMAIDTVTPTAIKEPEIELCKVSNFGLFTVSSYPVLLFNSLVIVSLLSSSFYPHKKCDRPVGEKR
jgi:hypothetical protein